jgi:hypothetical protein
MLKLRMREAKRIVKKLYDANIPVLLVGSTGTGKTAIAVELTKELSERKNKEVPLIVFRLANESPENIGGIPRPSKDDPETYEKILSKKLITIIRKESILFLDELNRAPAWNQNAIMNVIFERDIDGRKIHEETYILAAANIGNRFTSTYPIDPGVLTRFAIINVLPDINETNEYLRKAEDENTIRFLEPLKDTYQKFLDRYAEFEPIEPEFNQRTYQFMVRVLSKYQKDPDLRNLLLSVVPPEVCDFTLSSIDFKKIEEIVKGRNVEISPEEIPVVLAVLSGWNYENDEEFMNAIRFAKEITDKFNLPDSFHAFLTYLTEKNQKRVVENLGKIMKIVPNFKEFTTKFPTDLNQ